MPDMMAIERDIHLGMAERAEFLANCLPEKSKERLIQLKNAICHTIVANTNNEEAAKKLVFIISTEFPDEKLDLNQLFKQLLGKEKKV